MRLQEAQHEIDRLARIPFGDLFTPEQLENIIRNKGKSGQLLELAIGLNLTNTTLDFEDGELKTNKCDRRSQPLETMFITQISSIIDELLDVIPFIDSKLYKKINNMLYVPISKEGDPNGWMFFPSIHVDLSLIKYRELLEILENDYYRICNAMNQQLSQSPRSTLHTISGDFIQIRTKDSKPYTPITSINYGRVISNKNRAFYFKREFMKYIIDLEN